MDEGPDSAPACRVSEPGEAPFPPVPPAELLFPPEHLSPEVLLGGDLGPRDSQPSVHVEEDEGLEEPWNLLREDCPNASEIELASPDFEYELSSREERDWYSPVGEPPNTDESWDFVPEQSSNTARSVDRDTNVWLQGKAAEEDATQAAVVAFCKKRRLEIPRQPWEPARTALQQSFVDIFDHVPSVGLMETLKGQEAPKDRGRDEPNEIPWTVTRRLSRVRLTLSDDDIRDGALRRLKVLILLDPEATSLGRSLLQQGMSLESDEVIARSIADAFRAKASTTLQKRALSLQAWSVMSYDLRFESPWRLSEQQAYMLFCKLRESGAKPSTASHFLEALGFLHGVAVLLHMPLDVVLSSRVRGIARDLKLTKEPLRQRDPLSWARVTALEDCMRHGTMWLRCIVGMFLFCLHTCCRWSDAQRLKKLELLGRGRGQLLVGSGLGSKTSLTADAQTKFLPYVCVALGVSNTPWAASWLEAREHEGLDFSAGCIPTWSHRLGQWGSSPMSTEEAAEILLEVLESRGLGVSSDESIGTHSLKATLISWAGWSSVVKFTPKEKLLMGHHYKQGGSATLVYSRQFYVTLAGKVLALFDSIRSGDFNPDLSTAERVEAVASAHFNRSEEVAPPLNDEAAEVASQASKSAESEAEYVERRGERVHARLPFVGCTPDELRVHTLSCIVHRVRDATSFFCGRPVTPRYREYAMGDEDEPEPCIQCRRASEPES